MSRALDDLDPKFRPLAVELIARCVEHGVCIVIVNTRRTEAEQRVNLAKGTSWVQHSKHQDGLAIDIAPYDTYELHGDDKLQWNADDPVWLLMGRIGQDMGLGWGGEWKVKDLGHFELKS